MSQPSPVFVATLGGKAQIVTFALDALLQQGVFINEVVVLHLAPQDPGNRLHRALAQVKQEFKGERYRGRACRFRSVALVRPDGKQLEDLDSRGAVSDTWRVLNRVIGELKAQQREIHLCLAGGRRLLSILAMSVAALHFDYNDRIWHLYTSSELREEAAEGAILHAPPDTKQPFLLEVPIMPGSETFPALRTLLSASPEEVIAARRGYLEQADQKRCEKVWGRLTPRQKEVLSLIAQGKNRQEVASTLHITPATVSTHQSTIYDICREVWAFPDGHPLDYRWLEKYFGRWIAPDRL